jgi:SAM-dependent methyltransferase
VRLVRKIPFVWKAALGLADVVFRTVMTPFGLGRRPGAIAEPAGLVASTDRLNLAAEHYFASFDNPAFLLNKPFGDTEDFSRHLFSLGVVSSALGLRPSDVVVEFGAGSCWVSHFLNKFGCKTISVDVSKTALDLGRRMFEKDPSTNWSRAPEFLVYDGHRLPLDDASCDRIVVIDAFHHVPNQREILTEMFRVLKPDGIVGMSEPGSGHASTPDSVHEVETYGVLENELVIEDLAVLARSCGFAAVTVVAVSPDSLWEVPAEDLGAFVQGKGFVKYWRHHSNALFANHYILLHKGDPAPSTRRPKLLRAHIMLDPATVIQVARGERARVTVRLENRDDTRWLAGEGGGWTRLGGHLHKDGELVDLDWLRVALPCDISKNDAVTLDITLPAMSEPGIYDVVFDLVIEGRTWFEAHGSNTASVRVVVS